MKRKTFWAVAGIASLMWIGQSLNVQATETFDPVEYVNPLMGSESTFELSTGNTYPATARPWGMNFWTPQTGKMGDGWQYQYTATKINGFKQTHQPSPWINDFGQFSIMPMVNKPEFDMQKHDIVTELTPTDRAAMFRFTFPENEHSYVAVDPFDKGSYVKVVPEENKIIGYTTKNSGGVPEGFKNYFIIEFDKPFTYQATVADGKLTEGKLEQEADHAGAIIGFKTHKGEVVHAKVASSFISFDQAELNMKELGNDSFDKIKEDGKKAWNDLLGRIEVDGGNLDQYRVFYSCMYRALLFPHKFYEIDKEGKVVHYSPTTGEVLPGYYYTGTGLWDTFRCLFPFLNMMFPSVNKEMQEGFLNAYRESGFYPEWSSPGHRGCMVGNNTASMLVDAYLKGVKVDDTETLWKGLMASVNGVHPTVSSSGRLGYQYYNELGYVPYDVNIRENAARTLEYAYDDWCIYQLAKELKRPKSEIDLFAKRAMNYKNLYDPETKLMRGKNKDGKFQSPFSPLKWGDAFTEGNSWHYSWSVFHDPQGLINLMGGKAEFVQMLDSVFAVPPLFDDSYYGGVIHEIREMTVMNMGNYAHGNQPIQHMIYLYNYAGEPWKAQYWLRQVMDRMYTPGPDGYCGDEDNGQTSAWYVFSALGFYPVCPGTPQYVLGAPLFKKAILHFENGKSLVINAPENSHENIYIESMKFNGQDYTKNYLDYNEMMKGGVLDIEMGDKPNKQRGIQPEDAPYSFSNEKN